MLIFFNLILIVKAVLMTDDSDHEMISVQSGVLISFRGIKGFLWSQIEIFTSINDNALNKCMFRKESLYFGEYFSPFCNWGL